MSEMYAYSMAAAHERLPHFTMLNFMVSNTGMNDEGWKWIDRIGSRVCESSIDGIYYPGRSMPSVLHYCQVFSAGDFNFHKSHVKSNLFDCDQPLMPVLPKDLGTVEYKIEDGQVLKNSCISVALI